LDNHYLQADVLSILPTKFGYSYSYICKKFKGAYQCSPAVYLQSKRMEYAKQALRDGMTVTAVAEKLGYSSPFNFSRAYKKHFGAAPTK
jgi:AraC-like DNA-binding protein